MGVYTTTLQLHMGVHATTHGGIRRLVEWDAHNSDLPENYEVKASDFVVKLEEMFPL